MPTRTTTTVLKRFCVIAAVTALMGAISFQPAGARQKIREAFFAVYPDAVGTTIETVPSHTNHCGVCHYDFGGGGTRNPYGVALGDTIDFFPNTDEGRQQAVQAIENYDSEGDGYVSITEITDTMTFDNTPTFPGLKPANVGNVSNVDLADIETHLVPSTGGDTTPPEVVILDPNGGELLIANEETTVQWFADDENGVAAVDLYISDDNGTTFIPFAVGLDNTGSYSWFPANRPTGQAIVRAVAIDNSFNEGADESDATFTIESPSGGLVPSTLRDFDQPGSQPFEAGILNNPEACQVCHGGYDEEVEPYFNWRGSMMSNASRDLLMEANMAIANQDAPESGDLCLRCHIPKGWLQGRSVPTDGSRMLETDRIGVACDFCHRLVDPIYDPGASPPEDEPILDELRFPGTVFANGMAVVDPTGARRGPFLNAGSGHPVLVSPFHREAAFCGTCHDVSNTAFEDDGTGEYVPNDFDATAGDFSSQTLLPVERTYSEWFYSEYNTVQGVYAPQFGGNRDYVATCQDCHMRDVTGKGCNFDEAPIRDDLPLHDMTGGSTWYAGLLDSLYPGAIDPAAVESGIERARYMLQNAATVELSRSGAELEVTVTNETGHKLPTGYPEGRRIWINVKFYDRYMNLVSESGAYDFDTGVLTHDDEIKVYEIKPGLDEITAPIVGEPEGPSFHFVMNNEVYMDNRIPPRGFTNMAYESFGGQHVDYSYEDGQYWDVTSYAIPQSAETAEVTLYYQSTSKEFVEFLLEENVTDDSGQTLFDVWDTNGKCPPEMMWTGSIQVGGHPKFKTPVYQTW